MNTHVSDLTHTRSSGWPVLYASIFQLLFRHQSSKHTTLKIHLTQRQAGIVWSTTVLVPSYQSDWKRNLPMYVFGRIELSVSLAVSLWQCSPQIALNRSTCFLWMDKIGSIYIFSHRYWSQQVFLFPFATHHWRWLTKASIVIILFVKVLTALKRNTFYNFSVVLSFQLLCLPTLSKHFLRNGETNTRSEVEKGS